jgi:AMP-polyphosphate phosphotransferase
MGQKRKQAGTEGFLIQGRPELDRLANDHEVSASAFEKRIKPLQETLQHIQQAYLGSRERAVVVLEGWDTAGKGGLVRRLGWTFDPRSFRVHSIAAPNSIEARQHYLQRFWERLPQHGQITVFDRSWYGRVLVERVENLTPEPDWQRAYAEINSIERMLVDDGVRLVKLFLHISHEEQAQRFRDRMENPLKRWKLSYEDFRNHALWDGYQTAIEDMVERTSTEAAPWHIIPSNDKPFSRLAAFGIIADRLGQGIDTTPRELDAEIRYLAEKTLGGG